LSIQAVAWALNQRRVKLPTRRLVLMCLANYADAKGANSFPSLVRLSLDTGLDERNVRRHLRALEQDGVIRPGNQLIAAAHIARADRRPTVYDILMG
jgi:hypothetical protein